MKINGKVGELWRSRATGVVFKLTSVISGGGGPRVWDAIQVHPPGVTVEQKARYIDDADLGEIWEPVYKETREMNGAVGQRWRCGKNDNIVVELLGLSNRPSADAIWDAVERPPVGVPDRGNYFGIADADLGEIWEPLRGEVVTMNGRVEELWRSRATGRIFKLTGLRWADAGREHPIWDTIEVPPIGVFVEAKATAIIADADLGEIWEPVYKENLEAEAYKTVEAVDHPQHYGGDSDYEAIKVMEAWHGQEAVYFFCILSAEKYLCRAGKKSGETTERDLKKAAWYTSYAAELKRKMEARQP